MGPCAESGRLARPWRPLLAPPARVFASPTTNPAHAMPSAHAMQPALASATARSVIRELSVPIDVAMASLSVGPCRGRIAAALRRTRQSAGDAPPGRWAHGARWARVVASDYAALRLPASGDHIGHSRRAGRVARRRRRSAARQRSRRERSTTSNPRQLPRASRQVRSPDHHSPCRAHLQFSGHLCTSRSLT